jgi:alanine racemase
MRYPELGMNMVRAGIILYGLYPSEEIEKTISLKPVMKLKSHIIFIKKVDAGTTVGYGATYVCQRPTTIATVSIGYGDGYPRALSNKGRVLIGSQAYPIIGRICMDQLMVDITDAEDEIKQGDEVILVGCQGSECISVEEVASAGDSFNYEFICNINRRIPRVYTRDGKIVEIVNYLIS